MNQKNQIIVLVVLAVIAVLVWGYEWSGSASVTQTQMSIGQYQPLAKENPQLHWAELERAQKTEYKSNGRNPFSMIVPPTPEEVARNSHKNDPPPVPVVQPPPPPTQAFLPPNLKFFGYGTVPQGSPKRAFFTDGDDVYVVREGDTLLGRYRILKVNGANLEFQEISSGLHGTTPLEEQAAPPSA